VSGAEAARKLFSQSCTFVRAVAAPDQMPPPGMPEVAFAGRSNAGKSSLINALTGRKGLARASGTPGRTQQIVFFNLADRLTIADLPGYGFAKAPKAEAAAWNALMRDYLQNRASLRCVVLAIDSRHGILANDRDMMNRLDRAGVSYQAVLTKADRLRPAERDARRDQVAAALARHPAARTDAIVTSAEEGLGLEELRAFLAEFAAP